MEYPPLVCCMVSRLSHAPAFEGHGGCPVFLEGDHRAAQCHCEESGRTEYDTHHVSRTTVIQLYTYTHAHIHTCTHAPYTHMHTHTHTRIRTNALFSGLHNSLCRFRTASRSGGLGTRLHVIDTALAAGYSQLHSSLPFPLLPLFPHMPHPLPSYATPSFPHMPHPPSLTCHTPTSAAAVLHLGLPRPHGPILHAVPVGGGGGGAPQRLLPPGRPRPAGRTLVQGLPATLTQGTGGPCCWQYTPLKPGPHTMPT